MAVVDHGWRLVTAYGEPWQLYDLKNDRTETKDLANSNPERMKAMLALQAAYNQREDSNPQVTGGQLEPTYIPIYDAQGKIGPCGKSRVPNEIYSRIVAAEQAKGRRLSESDLAQIKAQADAQLARKEQSGKAGKHKKDDEEGSNE